MPQDQPKIERVPTFWETLMQQLLPTLQNPDAMEENAQLLQQGGSGNSPEKMAKILQVAGRGVADAAGAGVRANTPQSMEDVALEMSPLGPAVGKAIGLIPPKFIRPMVERLRARVATEGLKPDVAMVVEKAITDNPMVASHLNTIRMQNAPDEFGKLGSPDADGVYNHIIRPWAPDARYKAAIAQNPELLRPFIDDPKLNVRGGEIILANHLSGDPLQDTVRHEMNHAAQDVAGKLPQLLDWTDNIEYSARPQEIGSRISEMRGRWLRKYPDQKFNYPAALQTELNLLENQYALNPEHYPSLNESIMYMNEQLKPKGLKITATMPGNPLKLPASMAPRRRFKVEKVVLEPAQMPMFDY